MGKAVSRHFSRNSAFLELKANRSDESNKIGALWNFEKRMYRSSHWAFVNYPYRYLAKMNSPQAKAESILLSISWLKSRTARSLMLNQILRIPETGSPRRGRSQLYQLGFRAFFSVSEYERRWFVPKPACRYRAQS